MKKARFRILAVSLGVVLPTVLLVACGSPATQKSEAPESPPAKESATTTAQTADNQCPDPPPCGDDCSNYPFEPTDCWTTQYGPAKANIIIGSGLTTTNNLYCNGGTYALCFFSGPPDPTGTSSDNEPLPCVLEGDIANCTCQVYTSGAYFVDINAIENLGAYYETVTACGSDGSGCANIANCGKDGNEPGCANQTSAPVCQYVQNQNPDDPTVSLIPKADLVSAFSFAMDDDYKIGSTSCDDGLYAGCMTAPCFFEDGAEQPPSDGDPIQCECPTYKGVYQVGQSDQECPIPSADGVISYVWSAANSITGDDQQ